MKQPVKVLAICDLFVPAYCMADALSLLNPTHLEVIEWPARDEAELHHRVRQIEQFGPGAHAPPDAVWKYAREAELIVTHMCPLGADLIEQAVHLRMVGVCRAGTENVDTQAVQARSIRLYQVPGRNAVAVAEFTVGLILAQRRNIARAHLSLVTGGWRKTFVNDGQFTELAGKTIGLVGFGAVGQMVAARLAPFGVQLVVHDPFQSGPVIERQGGRALPLPELLRSSDVVSLHTRRSPQEPPLIGAPELALMKPTAILINTARAHLVDVEALVHVLQHRRIAGAALDVFE